MRPVPDTVDPFVATAPGARVALYTALAERGPVQRFLLPTGKPAWLVTGHAEVKAALTDSRLVKAAIPIGSALRKERMRAASGDRPVSGVERLRPQRALAPEQDVAGG